MSIARGTVQLYRIRFWKNFDNIEVDLINGGRKTLHLSNYTYFPHINPELWEFKPQPTWMTQDENSLILTPPGLGER